MSAIRLNYNDNKAIKCSRNVEVLILQLYN